MGRVLRVPVLAGLAVVVVVAVAVRLPDLNDPPLDFHPTRQYHGLNNARRIYLEWSAHPSARDREVARLVWARSAQLEPPILEGLAAAGYVVSGGERPWIGRFLSMLMWTGGAVALFGLARRLLHDEWTGLIAAAMMLLLPYTVPASSSFQPDPSSVALTVIAVWLILRYDDRPSAGRLVAAAAVGGAAVLMKAVAAPFVGGVFLAVLVARHGLRRALVQRSLLIFALVAVAPPALYYVVGVVIGSDLGTHAGETFILSMLTTGEFWRGWARNIESVTTVVLAGFALVAGVGLAPDKRARLVVIALWAAYVAGGIAVTYHTATHDYYHLPLVPIVGLGVAIAFSRVPLGKVPVACALIAALVIAGVLGVSRVPDAEQTAFVAESVRIGDQVDHSSHALYLAEAYGAPLAYHGRVAGVAWPHTYDLRVGRPMTLDERWRTTSRAVGGAEWFIVTDLGELDRQPGLARRLARYRVAVEDSSYRIYDLRERDG